MNAFEQKILASVAPENFVGRAAETEIIRQHALNAGQSSALIVSSAPNAGASELLRQVYDRFFTAQTEKVPFYFAVKASDKTATNCAVRFLHAFITQTIAFRHQDARIIDVAPDVCEFAELAVAVDRHWINRLVTTCQNDSSLNNARAFLRTCLSAPLRAAAYGVKPLIIIDNLHEADFFADEIDFVEEIKETFGRSGVSFILAGNRRFMSQMTMTGNNRLINAKILPIEPLDFAAAGSLIERLATQNDIEINESARDLIAVKTQGKPLLIESLIQAATGRQINLDSFRQVGQIYTDEILGGGIGKFYDAILNKVIPDVAAQNFFVELFQIENTKISTEEWSRKVNADPPTANRLLARLNAFEIIRLSSNRIEAMTENEVLGDYAAARFRLESAENRATAVNDIAANFLKHAPPRMAKFYRENASVNLRELLALFDRQAMPIALLDYAAYRERLEKSETTDDVLENSEKIVLPQMIFTAHTAAFYPPFEKIIEKNRSAIATGFVAKKYTDADEIVWLAAEIDSKLEASIETTEFWCDRLEAIALNCNFAKYKIWLIAPEGFAPEAVEMLKQRNGYGSSRRQIELLKDFLKKGASSDENKSALEYEMTIPMGDDSELIAAAMIEELARRHNFASKAINQMKTAVVEACINAAEHSLSPKRKIHQKVTVEANKITINVRNRGLRLIDRSESENGRNENRRGWGLKLIESLMDESKIEDVDDGTEISMVKYRR